MNSHGTFTPVKWEENTIDQISAVKKITKASVILDFGECEIAGKATVEWMMFYSHADEKDQHNSSAAFVGLMRFNGTLNGKSGSFVMADRGSFKNGALNASLTILPGSGTGDLAAISGSAKYASSSSAVDFEMEYEI
ncbi:MAG TPA: DUF3224 domain-containing protein [Candidatus Kapabacteria bacterium]|jgi:hypothetical protein|nr:DUF3224 domain-containing protein [Candidatus Kapabacteria bacterium]